MFPVRLLTRAGPWPAVGCAVVLAGLTAAFVDLAPAVETDFFFARDDPQLRASREIAERFPASEQIIVRAEDLAGNAGAYRARIARLTEELRELPGVTGVRSIATDDPRSPLFRRILATPDPAATNVVVQTGSVDPERFVPLLEAVVARHAGAELDLAMSGVPVIVELIRRSLWRDLVLFSLAALGVFGVLILLIYRDPAVLGGTLVACVLAVSAALLANHALDVGIGLLTANLVTIVFVLTLSHVVFLTGNWKRVSAGGARGTEAAGLAVAETFEASFWSMSTTLLGFLSLLAASAKPLRELGVAGAVGTVCAMAAAYAAYPAFLARWARPGVGGAAAATTHAVPTSRARWPVVAATGALIVALGSGLARLDTDPGLLTYFAEGSTLREGLERVDADGGSAPLNVVVRDASGGLLDTPPAYERLGAYQEALEADPDVGAVLSPRVLLEHARAQPLAGFLSLRILLNLLDSEQFERIASSFVNADRTEGLYFLRMRESGRTAPRAEVIERVRALAGEADLEIVSVGGLYDLQAQLGRLIASSLRVGIGGLLALFLLVAWAVSRSPGTTARMWLCLAAVPLVVLGTFGHLGISVDIITSPAANIALAMGVDSMIHLVVRVRRLGAAGLPAGAAWAAGLAQIRGPVLAATGTIGAGFGIFVLSSFPPTGRFGLAVILGTATAAWMTLGVLPRVAVPRQAAGSAPVSV